MGAIFIGFGHRFPAPGAKAGWFVVAKIRLWPAGFVKHATAAVAFQERLSPLDGNQRDKEKTDVMVQPFPAGRREAAVRTGPRLIIHLIFFGLHAADENEDAPPRQPAVSCFEPVGSKSRTSMI